jgi:hypothetical protein
MNTTFGNVTKATLLTRGTQVSSYTAQAAQASFDCVEEDGLTSSSNLTLTEMQ